jgi:hypothetical protein
MNIKEIGWESTHYINVVKTEECVNTAMNLRVQCIVQNFLTCCETVSEQETAPRR